MNNNRYCFESILRNIAFHSVRLTDLLEFRVFLVFSNESHLRGVCRGRCRATGHAVRVRARECRRQTVVRRSPQQLQQTHQTRRQQL